MSDLKLSLEILNGPLDGQVIIIKEKAEWGKAGDGPLSFPWDEELGTPQAHFLLEAGQWWLEVYPNARSTRHNMEQVQGKVALEQGDLLKAANTWLLVREME